MALIQCPECSGSISDRALSCPHCGLPIAGPKQDSGKYAVAALDAGPVPDETIERLSQIDCLTRDAARKTIDSAPTVLVRTLARKQAAEYAAALSRYCTVKIVADEYADTVEDVMNAEDAFFAPKCKSSPQGFWQTAPSPLSFWQTVGAAFFGCALWGLLVALFSRL